MLKTIGTKFYSYSFDDTNETTSVTATLFGDDSNGNLKLTIKTEKVGPYLSGGKRTEKKSSNVGTVSKPNVAVIRSQTAKGNDYHGFPAEWRAFNGLTYRNISAMIFDWAQTNMKDEEDDDNLKRKQIIDKLDKMNGEDLDKIRKMLHLASADDKMIRLAKEMEKLAKGE